MSSTPKEHDSGPSTPNANSFHQGHHHGRRLVQFVRPNGVKVHIAHTPEHHEQLRRELSEKHSEGEFDVLINGSPEHISAVRELHSHHLARRATLRETHGELYEQFESVKNELDQLSTELHMLTDHGVALDANFSKYGYSAHLRTKDDSETNLVYGDDASSIRKSEDRSAEALKFWRRPTIRQYFHKGLLWRSARTGEVFSFELFVDLVYVGVIGIIGDKTAQSPDGKSFVQYIILMCLSYKIWNDATMIVNWFEIDDISQRLSVLLYIVFLFGFTTNIVYAWESTYTAMISFYLAQQLFKANWYLWIGYLLPNIVGTMIYNAIITYISAALWIGSVHLRYPTQLALIFLSIVFDLFGSVAVIVFLRPHKGGRVESMFQKYFEFYPAINIEHRVERTNAFISLVFGYSVLTILFQNRDSFPMNAFFGKAILGLVQAFCFNWIYFEIDGILIHVHAIRRHFATSLLWVSAHLPLVMGYVLAAATLSQLILAHDTKDSSVETLGEEYTDRSKAIVPSGIRWFYCGGIGVALLSMSAISFSHIHKRLKNPRLKKRPRLVVRAAVAIIIICLPLAHSLDSLDLIAITTCLVLSILCLDLFGNSCEGDRFWSGGFCDEEKRKCAYVANCKVGRHRRREIEKALHRGERVTLSDILRRHGSTSSIESGESDLHEGWHGGHF